MTIMMLLRLVSNSIVLMTINGLIHNDSNVMIYIGNKR